MGEETISKKYDLEDRTLRFARRIIAFTERMAKSMADEEIAKQLVRSAGSIGANYIEANEVLGRKDFLMQIRISKKEAKESRYWLQLLCCAEQLEAERRELTQESTELMKILGAILEKST